MADYYLHKTAAHIDELLEKVEGLDNYDDTEVRGLINNKVDKVTGKGLSTNDFTDAYKTELDGLDTALDGKVDKETGKGLSTNDFTDAYKSAVDGAAPQSTTYTKTEIDNMIGDINTVLEEVL